MTAPAPGLVEITSFANASACSVARNKLRRKIRHQADIESFARASTLDRILRSHKVVCVEFARSQRCAISSPAVLPIAARTFQRLTSDVAGLNLG